MARKSPSLSYLPPAKLPERTYILPVSFPSAERASGNVCQGLPRTFLRVVSCSLSHRLQLSLSPGSRLRAGDPQAWATRRPYPTHPDGTASNRLSQPLVTLRRNKLAKHCSVSIKVSSNLFCCPLYDVFLLVERDGGACRSFNGQADGEIKRADTAVYHFCGFVLRSLQST